MTIRQSLNHNSFDFNKSNVKTAKFEKHKIINKLNLTVIQTQTDGRAILKC